MPQLFDRLDQVLVNPRNRKVFRLECSSFKMPYSELDVYIANNTLINEDIYQYWCDGYTGTPGAPAHQSNLAGLKIKREF